MPLDTDKPTDEYIEKEFDEPLNVKIATPKGKGFNLKIIGAIVALLILLVTLMLQFNVLGKKKKSPEEIEKEKNAQTETATPQAMQAVNGINALPATYQNPNLQRPQADQQNQMGAISNQEIIAAQQRAASQQGGFNGQNSQPQQSNPYANMQPNGYNGQQTQIPALSPEQQAAFEEKKRKTEREAERADRRENEERERIRQFEQERRQAFASPLRFNTGSKRSATNVAQNEQQQSNGKPTSPTMPNIQMPDLNMGGGDPNRQKDKQAYLDAERNKPIYLKSAMNYPVSRYQIMAGTIIPASMITGLNSDLPGQIIGQVRENVYDSVTGRYLLIPQTTRIIGEYSSNVTFGQDRVLIVWTRLIFPDGTSINLEGMPGVDLSGYAGTADKVNHHFLKIATGAILSSVMGASIKIAAGNQNAGESNFQQLAASGAAQTMGQAADKFVSKMIDQQPTIEIRPGTKYNIFVNKDIILKPFRK